MFVWNWRLALVSVAIVPLMVLPLGPVGRRMYGIRKKTREKRDEIESITQETLSISGHHADQVVRARGLRARRASTTPARELMQLEIDLAMVGRWFIASIMAMVVVGPALVWFGGGWLAIPRRLQVGDDRRVRLAYLGRLYGPASALAGVQVQIVSALAVFERIFDYLDMTPEEYDPPGAIALPSTSPARSPSRTSLSPTTATRDVLDGVSFHVRPGRDGRVRRPVGRRQDDDHAARAALLRSAERARAASTGTTCATSRSTRCARNIGIVTQETYLFHDTIAANLRYGKPDATDAELEAAARAANIARLHRGAARAATKRSSASAGTSSPAASASAWRSRACCSRIRAS